MAYKDLEKQRAAYRKWYASNKEKELAKRKRRAEAAGRGYVERPNCATNGAALQEALARGYKYYLASCGKHGASVFRAAKGGGRGSSGKCYPCSREHAWRRSGVQATWADFERLLLSQLGWCAICHSSTDDLDLDHCHEKGHIRGLLCGHCNRGIGLFKDDAELLRSAAEYLDP